MLFRSAANFSKSLLLGVGYSASIGGLATLIGTPPNLIFATFASDTYGVDISFAKWMMFGLPLSIVILIICWFYLTKIAFRVNVKTLPGGLEVIKQEKKEIGKASIEEKIVLTVFVFTASSGLFNAVIADPVYLQCERSVCTDSLQFSS